MSYQQSILGAVSGAVIGGCAAVGLIITAVFVAVANERTTSITTLVTAEYAAGDVGGFDVTVATGTGLLYFVLLGAVVGATQSFFSRPRQAVEC